MTNKIILFCLFIVVFSTCLLAAAAGYGTKTLQFVANMIAVKQCLKPVRPDWVIFESSLQNIRLQKQPNKIGDFWASLKQINFCKKCCGYYLGNFWKHLGNFFNQHLVTLKQCEKIWLFIKGLGDFLGYFEKSLFTSEFH